MARNTKQANSHKKSKLRLALAVFLIATIGLGVIGLTGQRTYANSDAATQACAGVSQLGVTCTSSQTAEEVAAGPVKEIVNLLTYIVGVACVLMFIYGGFRFITSGGNSDATKSARSTIIYALVGLVVVLLANVIITFVFNQAKDIQNGGSGGGTSCVDDPTTTVDECATTGTPTPPSGTNNPPSGAN